MRQGIFRLWILFTILILLAFISFSFSYEPPISSMSFEEAHFSFKETQLPEDIFIEICLERLPGQINSSECKMMWTSVRDSRFSEKKEVIISSVLISGVCLILLWSIYWVLAGFFKV